MLELGASRVWEWSKGPALSTTSFKDMLREKNHYSINGLAKGNEKGRLGSSSSSVHEASLSQARRVEFCLILIVFAPKHRD